MPNTFTHLIFLVSLVCTFSCARKEVYLLPDSGQPENTYVKKQNQPVPGPKTQLPEQPLPAADEPQPEPVLYTASTQPLLVPPSAALPAKVAFREILTVQPIVKSVAKLVKQQVKLIKAEKANLKKLNRPEDIGKPRNKLGMIGFYLGLGAILALIVASISGVGILSLLSFFAAIGGLITSKMGLSEIKRSPDTYSGKGQAVAGLIISIAILALFLIGIIALIVIINSFQ